MLFVHDRTLLMRLGGIAEQTLFKLDHPPSPWIDAGS